jgi:opacity protein-like surface antigen
VDAVAEYLVVGALVGHADARDMPFDGNLLGLEANARYHFPIFCRALPYVGLHAGYMRAELDDVSGDGIEYGAHAGVKFPVTANVFFDTQIRYTRADSSDMEMEADILMALFGFRYYFGEGADMNAQAAAEPRPFAAGDVELSAMGGYMFGSLADDNSSEDFEGHIILATGQMAYWLTDAITVGIGALGMYIPQAGDAGDMMGDDDAMLVGAELRGNYHFVNFGSFVPYVGLHGGAAYAVLGDTDSQTAFEYGAQVGFKYLLTDTVFIDTQVRHTRFDFDESDMNIDANATLAMVGLGFRL